jgi:hypothetical protein
MLTNNTKVIRVMSILAWVNILEPAVERVEGYVNGGVGRSRLSASHDTSPSMDVEQGSLLHILRSRHWYLPVRHTAYAGPQGGGQDVRSTSYSIPRVRFTEPNGSTRMCTLDQTVVQESSTVWCNLPHMDVGNARFRQEHEPVNR